MHSTFFEKGESESLISQSMTGQQKIQPSHQCQYYNEMKKANKIIKRKNRQIETLNKIIRNLRADISELNGNKKQSKEEVKELRQQLEIVNKRLSQLQLKQIDSQRQVCQSRLQSAQKLVNQQRQNKLKREQSQQYFSECQFSRNTNDDRYILIENSKKRDSMQCTFQSNQSNRAFHVPSAKPLNMGELFMGRKMKIEMEDNKLNKHSSWGKLEMLGNQSPHYASYTSLESSSARKIPTYGTKMNVQQAISYLKMQSQGLKMSIF